MWFDSTTWALILGALTLVARASSVTSHVVDTIGGGTLTTKGYKLALGSSFLTILNIIANLIALSFAYELWLAACINIITMLVHTVCFVLRHRAYLKAADKTNLEQDT